MLAMFDKGWPVAAPTTKLSPEQYGRIGARKRWGPPRIIRLTDMTPDQRRRVVDFVETVKTDNGWRPGPTLDSNGWAATGKTRPNTGKVHMLNTDTYVATLTIDLGDGSDPVVVETPYATSVPAAEVVEHIARRLPMIHSAVVAGPPRP